MTSSQIKKVLHDAFKSVMDVSAAREITFYESRPESTTRTLAEASLEIARGLDITFEKAHQLVNSSVQSYCNVYQEKGCTSYVCIETKLPLIVCHIYFLLTGKRQ